MEPLSQSQNNTIDNVVTKAGPFGAKDAPEADPGDQDESAPNIRIRVPCPQCHKHFKSQVTLKQHIKLKHSPTVTPGCMTGLMGSFNNTSSSGSSNASNSSGSNGSSMSSMMSTHDFLAQPMNSLMLSAEQQAQLQATQARLRQLQQTQTPATRVGEGLAAMAQQYQPQLPVALPGVQPQAPRRVVVLGALCLDQLTKLNGPLQRDAKLRAVQSQLSPGGNAGNVATALARLGGLAVQLVSLVGLDWHGKAIVDALMEDQIDCQLITTATDTATAFTYVLVEPDGTRTCVHHAAAHDLQPEPVQIECVRGASALVLDGRHPAAALQLVRQAAQHRVPVFLDCERLRDPALSPLLLRTVLYLNCPRAFVHSFTGCNDLLLGMANILFHHPQLRFITTTLGRDGAVLMLRDTRQLAAELPHVRSYEELRQGTPVAVEGFESGLPPILTAAFQASQLHHSTFLVVSCAGVSVPREQQTDSTGCGDAFMGALVWAALHLPDVRLALALACWYAAAKIRQLGARAGLLRRSDPALSGILTALSHALGRR